jgi:uncharacterized protein YjbI with pentapeptide repeats
MNDIYKGYTWKERVKFENETFQDCDFTGTIFENASFKDVTFENCIFFKSNMNHIGLWRSRFFYCKFINVDLRNMPMGADGGLFESCLFQKCDFRGQYFWYPHFNKCIFENCKLKKIDFNDSSFHYCKFIGKIEDVTFNGMYHKKETGIKPLDYVDFSEAVFGEYVGFENCELSTCIPPQGNIFKEMLYIVDLNEPNHLSTGSKDRCVIPQKYK